MYRLPGKIFKCLHGCCAWTTHDDFVDVRDDGEGELHVARSCFRNREIRGCNVPTTIDKGLKNLVAGNRYKDHPKLQAQLTRPLKKSSEQRERVVSQPAFAPAVEKIVCEIRNDENAQCLLGENPAKIIGGLCKGGRLERATGKLGEVPAGSLRRSWATQYRQQAYQNAALKSEMPSRHGV